jgi:acetolactate synthase I/II/III large subunit
VDRRSNNEITGGQAIAQILKELKVGRMFGMGGFQLLPFYDAVRRLGLEHSLINDERSAVFIADAYAKVTGRVGVCDATLGPGATNLVTGLVEALNAGSPLVVFVGDTHREHSWKNMTQESRQIEILRPACKELIRIEVVERIPELVRRAFAVATSGRPGPVIVDVPEDICHATHVFDEEEFECDPSTMSAPAVRCRPAQDDLERANKLIARATRPLMLCGGGVHISQAAPEVERFSEALNLPVAHTMSGKGAVACTSRLNAGLFGRYDRIANKLIEESDCLLVVGCKLGEIATKRYSLPLAGKPIIHLELLPEEFGRTTEPTIRLWGDVREGLAELRECIGAEAETIRDRQQAYTAEVAQAMEAWRSQVDERLRSRERPINMARLMHELNQAMPEDGILVADGGFAAHWGGLLYDTKKAGRGFVPDRGFASIGYGLPGSMGAALGAPGRQIAGITGDGGLNMSIGELETARRLNLPFVLIVVNNAASGYVKALQHLMYGGATYQSSDLVEMNYARIAEAMGCRGIRVEDPDAIANGLHAAFANTEGPTLLDVVVTRDPGKMLPGVDNRAVKVKAGDRVA